MCEGNCEGAPTIERRPGGRRDQRFPCDLARAPESGCDLLKPGARFRLALPNRLSACRLSYSNRNAGRSLSTNWSLIPQHGILVVECSSTSQCAKDQYSSLGIPL